MTDAELAQVPAHFRTAGDDAGTWCGRGETLAPNGRCPDGCDHADHYTNDGHPECEDTSFMRDAEPRTEQR